MIVLLTGRVPAHMSDIETGYKNYHHYIREGWSKSPKETFLTVRELLEATNPPREARLLDIGCATGELIHFLSTSFPSFHFTGADVFEPLLEQARTRLPRCSFVRASALELPREMDASFDIVTAVGVISIFDDIELQAFWDNVLRVVRPGGRVLVLGPLNEHGVDCVIRHRKRIEGRLGGWETGWNIHSQQTVAEALDGRCRSWRFHDFHIGIELAPRQDPVRTWTIRTESNERQLTNGLKLLIDLYFIDIER